MNFKIFRVKNYMAKKKKTRSIADKLAGNVQSEIGGPIANSGFSFQKNFGILKLIELYESGLDFVIIFDCHEDMIILNYREGTEESEFFQIKQKSKGFWSSTLLTKKENESSILGKLLSSKIENNDEKRSFSFVSDASFKLYRESELDKNGKEVKLHTENYLQVSMSDLNKSEFELIKNTVEGELSINFDEYSNRLVFRRITLPVDGGDSYCIGEIQKFLSRKYKGNCSFRPDIFYSSIFSIVDSKTSFRQETRTKELLIKHKCISKNEFEENLKSSDAIKSPLSRIELIDSKLSELEIPPLIVRRMKHHWQRFQIDLMGGVKISIQVKDKVALMVDNYAIENEDSELKKLIDDILENYKNTRIENIYSDEELKVIILNEVC